jgi:glucosamine--fructose-6-phosphate aminotransferase (isomerizing)
MVYDGKKLSFVKQRKVADLEEKAAKELTMNGTGYWSYKMGTHGVPNDVNSHPHFSNSEI